MSNMKAQKPTQKLPELSVFFPLYNEEENIEKLVEQSMKVFPKIADKFEVILVNDGSKDRTRKLGLKLEKKYKPVRLVSQRNKGYGGAVKRGFKESKYEWVFFSDGDLQFDLSEISKFIPFTKKNDLVIGYRKIRAEGLKRKLIADALKVWNRIFLGFPREIRDIDCAFKLIRKDVVKSFTPLVSDGAMVTTEFLLKSYKRGYKFKQIGVNHYKRQFGSSTGSNLKVIAKAVRDTFILSYLLAKESIRSIVVVNPIQRVKVGVSN